MGIAAGRFNGIDTGSASSPAVADWDGDSDLDVVSLA